jgi:hypothetical protein
MPSETTPPPFDTIALFCDVHATTCAAFHWEYSLGSIAAAMDETNAAPQVAGVLPPSPADDELDCVDADDDPGTEPAVVDVEPLPVTARDDVEAGVDTDALGPAGDVAFDAQAARATESVRVHGKRRRRMIARR